MIIKKTKIGSRLIFGFLFIFVLLFSLTFFGINRMDLLSKQTSLIYNHPLTVSNAVLRINTNIIKIHRSMKDVAMAQDNESMNEYSQIVNALEKEVFKDFEIINERFLGDKEKYESALEVFTNWKPIRDQVISLMREGKRVEAADITKGKCARHVVRIEKAMEALGNFAQHKAKDFLYLTEITRINAFYTTYVLAGLSALIAILFVIFFTRSISRPLVLIRDAINKIGRGELDTKITIESKDEIGQLASSFNKMTEDLKNITTSRDELNKEIAERKRLEEELRALSLTDDLTGLKNRRGFFTLTEHLLKIAKRQKQRIFMLYADLDNMKEINDTLGHKEGDNALIDIANILKSSYRESDVVARIGGDEFVVIPIGTTKEHVGIVTARLQEKLDIHNAKSNRRYNLSVSTGIAYYDPENPCSIDELLTQADKLMYEQKRYKKNSLSLLSPTNQ